MTVYMRVRNYLLRSRRDGGMYGFIHAYTRECQATLLFRLCDGEWDRSDRGWLMFSSLCCSLASVSVPKSVHIHIENCPPLRGSHSEPYWSLSRGDAYHTPAELGHLLPAPALSKHFSASRTTWSHFRNDCRSDLIKADPPLLLQHR